MKMLLDDGCKNDDSRFRYVFDAHLEIFFLSVLNIIIKFHEFYMNDYEAFRFYERRHKKCKFVVLFAALKISNVCTLPGPSLYRSTYSYYEQNSFLYTCTFNKIQLLSPTLRLTISGHIRRHKTEICQDFISLLLLLFSSFFFDKIINLNFVGFKEIEKFQIHYKFVYSFYKYDDLLSIQINL